MSGSPLTVPPPRDDDHDDVAWALRAASAQWRREAVADAVGWVRRAADTAEEIGASARAAELAQLAVALSGGPVAVAPPPPRAAMATLGDDIEYEMEEADLDEFDEVDEFDDVDEVDEVDDVDEVDEVPTIIPPRSESDEVEDLDDLDDVEEVEDPDADRIEDVTDDDDIVFDEAPSRPRADVFDPPISAQSELEPVSRGPASFGASRAPAPLGGRTLTPLALSPRTPSPRTPSPRTPSPRTPPASEKASRSPTDSRRRSQTSSGVDMPPSMRPNPSGLDLADDIDEDDEYGELRFDEERPTKKVSISDGPPPPDPGEVRRAPSAIPIARETAAEYATTRDRVQVHHDHDQIEQELGVDLSVRIRGQTKSASAPGTEEEAPGPSVKAPPGDYNDPFGSAVSPVPGRASVLPSRSPGSPDRVTSANTEPYGLAPSAALPPTAPHLSTEPPIEPPSTPTTAPPPGSVLEPDERPSQMPEVRPTGHPTGHSSAPRSSPALSSAPEPDDVDDLFAAISMPPPKPSGAAAAQTAAPSVAPGSPAVDSPRDSAAPHSTAPPSVLVQETEDGGILVDGIDLMEIPGLQDLPDDAALALARTARLVTLHRGEEISSFGVALVTRGAVQLMPTVVDAPCAHARKGEVLFTKGTLPAEVAVRAVGFEPGSRVAVFSKEALEVATSTSPWVADELAEVADRYLAFAGAVLGPLGRSLDDTFRFMVLEKCVVKSKAPGAIIGQAGAPMDGMYILGGGTLELLNDDGSVSGELRIGDFVFPETVLSASPARQTIRTGKGGALVLFANRMGAHELLATCPPLIELLAG